MKMNNLLYLKMVLNNNVEAVVNDETPGNAIHTEVIDSEEKWWRWTYWSKTRFADRAEEDIQQSSDEDEDNKK